MPLLDLVLLLLDLVLLLLDLVLLLLDLVLPLLGLDRQIQAQSGDLAACPELAEGIPLER